MTDSTLLSRLMHLSVYRSLVCRKSLRHAVINDYLAELLGESLLPQLQTGSLCFASVRQSVTAQIPWVSDADINWLYDFEQVTCHFFSSVEHE